MVISTCNRVEIIAHTTNGSRRPARISARSLSSHRRRTRRASLRIPRERRRAAFVPRCVQPGFHGRRRSPDPWPGQRSLRHRPRRRRRSRPTRSTLQPRLRRRQTRAQRNRRRIFFSLHRIGRSRTGEKDFRDAGRENSFHRRRRKNERTRRPPPDGPRLRLDLRLQPDLRTSGGPGAEIQRPSHQVRRSLFELRPRRHRHHLHRRRPTPFSAASTESNSSPAARTNPCSSSTSPSPATFRRTWPSSTASSPTTSTTCSRP